MISLYNPENLYHEAGENVVRIKEKKKDKGTFVFE